jgi:hypothetical protein
MDVVTEAARAWAARQGVIVAAEWFQDDAGIAAARAAGRRAATRALAACGGPPLPSHRLRDGRPPWPARFIGSISHAGGVAYAVVAPSGRMRSVGVDVEVRRQLPHADAEAVLGDDEQAWALASGDPDDAATALWSAKEAAFKAWNEADDGALTTVDPRRDMRVELAGEGDGARVHVTPLAELARSAVPIDGRMWRSVERVLVIVVLPA